MLPITHFILGLILSGGLVYFFDFSLIAGAIVLLSSVLIDIDHYFYYVHKKNDWGLKNSYNWFVEHTKKHYLKEISQKIKVAHTSIIKILLNLQKEKIINRIEKKYGKRNFPFFVANINNDEFKILKKINNLKSVYYSGIINFLELNFMPKSIILFGSYSRGEDIEGSDIDLFLETKEEEINLIRFEKILSRKINIYFKEDINECSKELQNNILNGILLKGELEFK